MFKYDENVGARYGIELLDDVTIRKTAQLGSLQSFLWVRNLVNHFIANPHPMVVPVLRFESLSEVPEAQGSKWGTYKYTYDMTRLPMLSRDEKDALNIFISNRYNVEKPCVVEERKNFPQLFAFMQQVFSDGYYTDIHDGNFLKDQDGNYRIIDIEGFRRFPGVEGQHGY